MENHFWFEDIPMPKSGIDIRKFRFLSYPLRCLHVAIGIYLLSLSKEFRNNYYGARSRLSSFYGGDLSLDGTGSLASVSRESLYFWPHYKRFARKVRDLFTNSSSGRVIVSLDISSYFDSLDVSHLLKRLYNYNKRSKNKEHSFDVNTVSLISEFYDWISGGDGGIPQTDNNITSSFIGDLYMKIGDLYSDNILRSNNYVKDYRLLRYVDDTYIYIEFKNNIPRYYKEKISYNIVSEISQTLHEKMSLRVNSKSRLYKSGSSRDVSQLISDLSATSMTEKKAKSFTSLFETKDIRSEKSKSDKFSYLEGYPEGTVKYILEALKDLTYKYGFNRYVTPKLKRLDESKIKALRMVYDENVQNMFYKKENKKELYKILKRIDFDAIYPQMGPILVLINMFSSIKNDFERYFVKKTNWSLEDCWICLEYILKNNKFSGPLFSRLINESSFGTVLKNPKRNTFEFSTSGYFNIKTNKIFNIHENKKYINQIKYRKINESYNRKGVALNHLLNEIHSICFINDKEVSDINDYKSHHVVNFLYNLGLSNEGILLVRSLFDLRNMNPISHPGSTNTPTEVVSESEYKKYRKGVGICIKKIFDKN
jgi:AbiA family abortive infection protein